MLNYDSAGIAHPPHFHPETREVVSTIHTWNTHNILFPPHKDKNRLLVTYTVGDNQLSPLSTIWNNPNCCCLLLFRLFLY